MPYPQIDPPVQPAGYTFSIWGLIYAWLTASAIYGVWKRRFDGHWDKVRSPLIGSLAIGTPWLWIAGNSAIWATITIFAMAAFAVMAMFRTPNQDRWWLRAPVAIYAGWLTAASFVSLGSTAAGYGVLFDSMGWAYAAIVMTLIVALTVLWHRPSAVEFGITIVWALIGIIAANITANPTVALIASAGILVVGTQTWRGYRAAT